MKAIILARVSTEEQMNEGQSIPAQLARQVMDAFRTVDWAKIKNDLRLLDYLVH